MVEGDPLVELDGLLALGRSGALDPEACRRLRELAPAVPGRARKIVEVLGRQGDSAAVDALLELPGTVPGIVEALFGAVRRGVVRRTAGGHEFPHMLALEFRSSKSRRFPGLLAHASAAFGPKLERIRVGARLHYRVALIEPPQEQIGPIELDVEHLHRELARLRGARLWLNGWCFDDHSNIAPKIRAPLLRAWFQWAAQPRANTAIDST